MLLETQGFYHSSGTVGMKGGPLRVMPLEARL